MMIITEKNSITKLLMIRKNFQVTMMTGEKIGFEEICECHKKKVEQA
jgi:hypothetical protein